MLILSTSSPRNNAAAWLPNMKMQSVDDTRHGIQLLIDMMYQASVGGDRLAPFGSPHRKSAKLCRATFRPARKSPSTETRGGDVTGAWTLDSMLDKHPDERILVEHWSVAIVLLTVMTCIHHHQST